MFIYAILLTCDKEQHRWDGELVADEDIKDVGDEGAKTFLTTKKQKRTTLIYQHMRKDPRPNSHHTASRGHIIVMSLPHEYRINSHPPLLLWALQILSMVHTIDVLLQTEMGSIIPLFSKNI